MKIRQFPTSHSRLPAYAATLIWFFAAIPCELAAQDDPSQRMLSLPDRELPELKQPQEFLKKLRSLMDSRQKSPSASSSAPDPQPSEKPGSSEKPGQFEELRNALQRLNEKLPPGFVPPDLSAVPPEQLKKALENPAVQQQMRDLLKQFAEDGVIPPSSAGNGPELPLPPESMKSLQDFLQQLADGDSLPKQQPSDETPLDPPIPDSGRSGVDRRTPEELAVPRPFRKLQPVPMPEVREPLSDAGLRIPKADVNGQAKEPSPGSPDDRSNQASEDAGVLQQRSFKALQDLLDQMSEPLKQQSDSSATPEVAPGTERNPAQRREAVTPPAAPRPLPSPSVRPPVPGSGGSDSLSSPPMDIREELERNGFGGTIRKLVEKAKQQSRQPISSGDEPSDPAGRSQPAEGSGSGLEQSVIRLLDGMKDDIAEIAKDGNFHEPSRRNEPRRRSSPRTSAEPQSESALNRLRKSVSEFFAGPSQSAQQNRPSGRLSSTSGVNPPPPELQFDLTPVAVLAGLLGAAAAGFFGLRFLKLRSADAIDPRAAANPIAPDEIHDRADVIRAFHEFAMRSTKSVQSWWTHRAVERVMITASPEKRAAVETLAHAYELARYLPQEVALTSEQIHSARDALQQFAANGQR